MKTSGILRAADTAALRAVSTTSPVLRRGALAVSLGTRVGAAWLATTAAMVAAGGRARRAGIEGLAAWVAAEAATGALKSVTSRRRPTLPHAKGPGSSSSMPSSHTAAAVAYAVAAGTRTPPLLAPLLVGAGTVGWSRLAVRRHFPTDVAVGAVVGVAVGGAVALASRRLAPVEEDEPAS